MSKRVAIKVVRRSYWITAVDMPYKDHTLDRAVAVFLRAADREWDRRNPNPKGVQSRPARPA